jgi:GT2 family glycosyltransferase
LDADDYFDKTFFEKGLQVFKRYSDVAVVTSHIQMFGEFRKISRPRGGNEYNFLFNNECPACALVKKSCWDKVGGYDENMKMGYEDWEFYIRITQQQWRIHVIPEILFYYRQTNKSTHKNDTLPNRLQLIDYIFEKHSKWYLQKVKELVVRKEILYTNSRVSFQNIFKMLKYRFKIKSHM